MSLVRLNSTMLDRMQADGGLNKDIVHRESRNHHRFVDKSDKSHPATEAAFVPYLHKRLHTTCDSTYTLKYQHTVPLPCCKPGASTGPNEAPETPKPASKPPAAV